MNGDQRELTSQLNQHWWLLAFRGLAAIVFGIVAFAWPGITLLGLVTVFGVYAIANGAFALVHALRAPRGHTRFGSLIFEALASIAAGVIALVWPGITTLAMVLLIAAWAIVTGVLEITAAIRLRKEIKGEWLLGLTGTAAILFGILLFFAPGAGALVMVWWTGGFALVFGVLLIALAFKARHWERTTIVSATA
ncbi:MAG: HdeD family acid-resistance protein [Verrucomicrobiota bacterium]